MNGDIRMMKEAIIRISRRVEVLEKASGVCAEAAPVPSSVPAPPVYASVPPASTSPQSSAFSSWIAEEWPMKVGALFFLLGMAWFVTYAFMNNWIGPMGRITMGILIGVGIVAFGAFRMRVSSNQGGVFLGLGTTTLILTIFAARTAYGFFSPPSALGMMTLAVVFSAYVSVIYRSRSVAIFSFLSGSVAPLLVGSPDANFVGLFSFLFFLCLGTLWIVRLTGWRSLTVIALVVMIFYSLPYILSTGLVSRTNALLFAFLFSGLFFFSGLLGVLRDKMMKQEDVAVVVLNGLLLLGWIYSYVPDTLQSFVTLTVAVVFSVASYGIFRGTGIALPVYLYSGNAVLFFFSATAFELSGATLTMAFALETGLLVVGTLLLTKSWRASQRLSWLMALPVLFSLVNLDRYSASYLFFSGQGVESLPVFTKDFFAILTLIVVTLGIGALFFIASSKKEEKNRLSCGVLFVLATLYLMFLVWHGLHRAILDIDMATLCALVSYTLVGIALYVKGGASSHSESRIIGGGVLAFVAVRLLLVDVWNMGIVGRIITFLTIGILFLVTAFFGKVKKATLESPMKVSIFFLGASLVFFPTVVLRANGQEENPSEVIAASELMKKIGSISISVPTVVEVPLTDPSFWRRVFVYEESMGTFQPSLLEAEVRDARTVTVQATLDGEGVIGAPLLLDRDYMTSTDFPVRNFSENVVEIRIVFDHPETLSGFMMHLDRYVSLPTRVEVLRMYDGSEKIALASSRVSDQVLRFPKEIGNEWILRFTYVQPLRSSEIVPIRDGISISGNAVRFLARPGESYVLYSQPDRPVSFRMGEAPNLSLDKDVLQISEPPSVGNSLYNMADVDADSIPDRRDNCVRLKNSDQNDENGNGLGDLCDDYDKDGVMNSEDNCPSHPNRDQANADGDKNGDVCDGEESRLTERYAILPWLALAVSAAVVGGLLASSMRKKSR